MAFVNTPSASLTFVWRDASGSAAQTVINVPFATPVAAVLAAADVLRPLLAAMSDAVVVGQSLTYSYVENAPATPVAGSRVEEKGFFSFNTSNGRTTSMTLPAIKDSALLSDGAINRLDPGVVALVTAMTAVDAIFAGADGSDITSLKRAYQRFNASTRSQLPNRG